MVFSIPQTPLLAQEAGDHAGNAVVAAENGDYWEAAKEGGLATLKGVEAVGNALVVGKGVTTVGKGVAKGVTRGAQGAKGAWHKVKKWWSPCKTNSFSEETEVWMCDGSTRPISELQEGDWVRARGVEDGQESCQRVERVWMHLESSQVRLELEDEVSGRLGWLDATLTHPMLLEDGTTQDAGGLEPGQWLGGIAGPVQVKSVALVDAQRMVYNLSVSGAHTFFVGEVGAWAHNCDWLDPSQIRFSQSSVNNAQVLTKSMKENGWIGDAIDVVKMSDGKLTAIDNTRVLAAHRAGIKVKANVRSYNDPLPSNMLNRFQNRQTKAYSKTWGEAVEFRVGKQRPGYRDTYPQGSAVTGSSD